MRTELILGTLDQSFDRGLNYYIESVTKCKVSPLLSDKDGAFIPTNIFFSNESFRDLFNPIYMFGASRELLDDSKNRFQKIQHRHFIPYMPVTSKGKIALYSRTPKGTEAELHGKLSIGFGGHIELSECAYFGEELSVQGSLYEKDSIDLVSTLISSALRELAEEFKLRDSNIVTETSFEDLDYDQEVVRQYGLRDHAIIVSNANEVDKRHLALVYRVEVKNVEELVIEDQLNLIGWFTQQEIKDKYFEDLEMWSKAIIALPDIQKIPSLF
jgi:predicted NUDIX family phosphoesterase